MTTFYIHWTSGHKSGHTSLAYDMATIERIERRYLAEYPDMVFELIPAEDE